MLTTIQHATIQFKVLNTTDTTANHADNVKPLNVYVAKRYFIVDNDPAERDAFVEWTSKQFKLEDRGELSWVLGMQVTRDRGRKTISLSQEQYVQDLVQRFSHLINHARSYSSPMDDKLTLTADMCPLPGSAEADRMATKRIDYMSLTGAYLWLSNVTYFHLCYASSQLARFVSNPGEEHYSAAIRVLVFLRDDRI